MQQLQNRQHAQRSLSRQDSLILASLVHEPKHALVLREVIEQAEGERVEPGALSRLVARLEERGWIEGENVGRPLRLYHLTARGILAVQSAEACCQREQQRERWNPVLRKGKEYIMRLVIWVLRLYPPAWRERYEAEMSALLEQHAFTSWTVLDLFIGAVDARLDPYYRGLRHPHPWEQLQRSWKVIGSASTAFGFAMFLWFLHTADLGIPPDVHCSLSNKTCPLRVEVTLLTPAVSNTIESMLTPLALLVFLVSLTGWVLSQMQREPGRNLLRLLSILVLIELLLAGMPGPWWTLVLAVPCVALVMESGGALLASGWRTVSHANAGQRTTKRGRVRRDVISLVLGLSVSQSMVLLCIAQGADLVAWWNLFLQSDFYALFLQTLVVPFVGAVLATLTVLVFFVRSAWALRAVYATPPRQL